MSSATGLVSLRQHAGASPRLLVLACLVGGAGSVLFAVLAQVLSPLVALLAIAGAVVALAMIYSPTCAILMVCFSVPFERIGRLTNDADAVAVSINRILGLIALAGLLLHVTLRKKKLRFGPAVALYGAYVGLAFLSNVWAYSPEETFRDSFRVAGNLLFFFLVWNMVSSYAEAKRTVLVWLIATMAAGVFSLGDYYLSSGNAVQEMEMGLTSTRLSSVVSDGAEMRAIGMNVRRLFGTTGHPTLFGLNNTMAIPFFLWAIRSQRGAWKFLWGLGIVISVACIVLSNTRAIFLLAGFTVLFCVARGLGRPNLKAGIALVVMALALVPFIPEDVYLRSLDPALYFSEKGDSIRVRFKFWEKSWELIQQTWTHGIGLGDETTLQKMVTDEQTGYLSTMGLKASAHNEYIWVMVELGIVGYILHWGFVALVTRASFRAASLLRRQGGVGEQYLFMIACQTVLIGVLLFAVQSEAFHYPLKAWWLTAAISCTVLEATRRSLATAGASGEDYMP